MHTPPFKHRLSLLKYTKYPAQKSYRLYTEQFSFPFSSSVFIHSAPSKTFINQQPSTIIHPHAHHTWCPQYVIASLYAVSSASLFPPSNSWHYRFSWGLIGHSNQQTRSFVFPTHNCCSSIYLTNRFLTCMFYLFD